MMAPRTNNFASHQSTDVGKLAQKIDCGHRMTRRQLDELLTPTHKQGIGADDAWPRPGFTLEKGLIFPEDASPAPLSRAVAAETVCRRNEEHAGKRRVVLALPHIAATRARPVSTAMRCSFQPLSK
jgi:hypothetical protein